MSNIKINNINLICSWKYKCKNNDCICSHKLEYNTTNSKEIFRGKCGHAYHKDCINRHLQINLNCPYCSDVVWEFEKELEYKDIMLYSN